MLTKFLLAVMVLTPVAVPKLEVHLKPPMCLEPCSTKVLITVPPQVALHGELCLHISRDDSDGVETSSCWPLTHREITVEVNEIYQGLYRLSVDVDGLSNSQTLTVVGAQP